MRLEQLQAFLAVTDTKSFQQAARYCRVTQSTISRQIQGLEASLGVPLFDRNGSITLTVCGERFLPHARKICQEWTVATQEIAELMDGKQPELCVAAIGSVCAHYLPATFELFNQDYPDVQLRVTSLGSDRALKVLRDGLVDLAVVMNNRFLTTSGAMVVDQLFEDTIEVLMAANHPLSHYNPVPWDQLAQYSHVVFKDGYGMRRLLEEQFHQQGLTLTVALELNSLDAFRGIVRRGQSIALLPHSALADAQLDPSLTIRSTAQPVLTREVVCVTTRDRLQIPPIQRFRDLLKIVITEQKAQQHLQVV
jgi:DNA-binding transcriptional LysR family regulator